ncbi:hypothetical protein Patl1_07024 [Pistacia atlantica]|uniref:Uncharacterized protein n=1 Tax=Pistacia atlantica TaxID=434234 RepID=A0ACC1AIL5_9ROSI|nr:hypothetical protein Patl1_07024 [Pistacia atlantica]
MSSCSTLHCYSHKRPAQAALVFLANDVTSHGTTVTGVTDSSTLCDKRQDDDIQMNKIQMGVGGNETAMIDGFNKLHDLESSLASFLQLLTTLSIALTVFQGSGMYFPEIFSLKLSSFDIAEDDEGTTSPSWKDDDIQQMGKIQMEVGGKETAKIVWGSSRKAIPTEDGFKELHDLESSFASFPIKSLQELKGCFDIGEDDEGSSSPTSVSFKTKKVEGPKNKPRGTMVAHCCIATGLMQVTVRSVYAAEDTSGAVVQHKGSFKILFSEHTLVLYRLTTFPWTIVANTCLSNLIVLLELHSAPICDTLLHEQALPLLIAISRHCPNKLAYAKMCRVQRKIEVILDMHGGIGLVSYCFLKMKDFVSAVFIDAVLKFD